MSDSKIMLWDIETFPNIMARWDIWHQGNPDYILKERSIICISYKFINEKTVHTISIRDFKKAFNKDMFDDGPLLQKFVNVLKTHEPRFLVAHNGDKFDLKIFNSRLIAHDFDSLQESQTVDTLKIAKRHFKFNSNRLDYLGKYLGVGRKIHTSKDMWLRCLDGEIDGFKEMEKYNKQDVLLLEDVYKKLAPYHYTHPAVFVDKADIVCHLCGSSNLRKQGYRYTRCYKYQSYFCKDCKARPRSYIREPI